jgi:hypothetical protein
VILVTVTVVRDSDGGSGDSDMTESNDIDSGDCDKSKSGGNDIGSKRIATVVRVVVLKAMR